MASSRGRVHLRSVETHNLALVMAMRLAMSRATERGEMEG